LDAQQELAVKVKIIGIAASTDYSTLFIYVTLQKRMPKRVERSDRMYKSEQGPLYFVCAFPIRA